MTLHRCGQQARDYGAKKASLLWQPLTCFDDKALRHQRTKQVFSGLWTLIGHKASSEKNYSPYARELLMLVAPSMLYVVYLGLVAMILQILFLSVNSWPEIAQLGSSDQWKYSAVYCNCIVTEAFTVARSPMAPGRENAATGLAIYKWRFLNCMWWGSGLL